MHPDGKWSRFERGMKSLKQFKHDKYEFIRLLATRSMLYSNPLSHEMLKRRRWRLLASKWNERRGIN